MFLAVAAAAGAAKLAVDHNRSVQREAMEANGLVLPRAIGVSPKAPTIARSAEDAVACLTLYKGIDFGECVVVHSACLPAPQTDLNRYPVAVIASYVDNKIVRGRSKTDIIEKLEALEKQASGCFCFCFPLALALLALFPARRSPTPSARNTTAPSPSCATTATSAPRASWTWTTRRTWTRATLPCARRRACRQTGWQ